MRLSRAMWSHEDWCGRFPGVRSWTTATGKALYEAFTMERLLTSFTRALVACLLGGVVTTTTAGVFLDVGGNFRIVDVPHPFFLAEDVNDAGQIVGTFPFMDSKGAFHNHGGLVDVGGHFVPIDFPGASDTIVSGINNAGQIVGHYVVA